MNNLTNNGQKLIDLPKNFATGVINNFKTTFNIDNFVNYLTTDNYDEIKDYSKSVIQTGVTLYGGYKIVQKEIKLVRDNIKQHNGIIIDNDVLNSPRKNSANKLDPYHSFSDIVDNYAGFGTKTPLGNNANLYQLDGALNGIQGRFEWIVQDGFTTHRMFVPNGTMNGVPIIK